MAHSSKLQVITTVHTASLSNSVLGCPWAAREGSSTESATVPNTEVDGRTSREWLDRIVAYCDYQITALPKRDRWHPLRLHYNGIVHAVNSVRYYDEDRARLHMALPELNPAPALLPHELDYQTWRRDSLAMALVQENPNLTDYKLLSHLPKNKLARMLAETRQANARTARAVMA